jgi:hypothetical protein
MQEKALFGSFYGSSAYHAKTNQNHNNRERHSNGASLHTNEIDSPSEKLTWAFQAVPTLYSVYQKVEFPPIYSFIYYYYFCSIYIYLFLFLLHHDDVSVSLYLFIFIFFVLERPFVIFSFFADFQPLLIVLCQY